MGLPDEKLIKSVLEKVHQVCVFGSTNNPYNTGECPYGTDKGGYKLTRHSLSFFALKALKAVMHAKSDFLIEIEKICSFYIEHESNPNSVEPKDSMGRLLYLYGLIVGAKELTYKYGYGNCQHMSDLAFIEFILAGINCGIHIIRFNNSSDSAIEELNTAVLGDWPKPGCIIVSPWEDHRGCYYIWNGTCEETPELFKQKLTHTRCIFSISNEDLWQEKEAIKSLLKEKNYENWLQDNIRKTILRVTKNKFLDHINQVAFFKSPEGAPFGNYQNLIMWGSTSKANYEKVEKIKENLLEDETVKNIFKMPRV